MEKKSKKQTKRKKKPQEPNPKLAHMTEPWQRLYELIQKKVK